MLALCLLLLVEHTLQQEELPKIIGGKRKRRKFGGDSLIVEGDGHFDKDGKFDPKFGDIGDDTETTLINGEYVETKVSERKPSMIKLPGRDEFLHLPDRESVLRFKTFADFATGK